MKKSFPPQSFIHRSYWIAALVCCLSFLLASMGRANAGFTPVGTTYLNVYFNDGTGTTVPPTVSPYSPSETTGTGNHVGTPLSTAGQTWLTSGSGYPGGVFANWPATPPATWTSSGVTADVSYQQGSYYIGSNSVPSSGVAPEGTSLSVVNPNNTIAELRLDWSTTYIYSGPPYVWSAGGAVTRTTEITDPNNNFETCIVGGNSGGSTPAWPPLHAAAGTITSDGGVVKWEVINTPAPGIMAVNLSGTVNNFSAVAGQESFSLSGLPVTAANTARLQLGGNFITFGIPGSLESFVDTSLWNGTPQYLAGYQNAGTFFATTQTGIVPAQQLMYNNDQITVSGYLDVFVDPGSIQVQIAAPVQLGITTYSNSPVVLFPTPPGTNYVLQMSTNLTTDNWVTVTNGVPFTGIEITNPPSPAFFRLY